MIFLLSQITIKFPLSEMLRIEEQRHKALAWVGDVIDSDIPNSEIVNKTIEELRKMKETKGIVSQIPQMYLDNSTTTYLENTYPFLAS